MNEYPRDSKDFSPKIKKKNINSDQDTFVRNAAVVKKRRVKKGPFGKNSSPEAKAANGSVGRRAVDYIVGQE